jgi:aspartate 1-decarboxylase
MQVQVLRGKIHKATITQADLDYNGSITIDEQLLKETGILPYEKVLVSNMSNGTRFETYVIVAPPGSGTICVNGAAARLAKAGDRVIIMAFASMDQEEAKQFKPRIVIVDEKNSIIDRKS